MRTKEQILKDNSIEVENFEKYGNGIIFWIIVEKFAQQREIDGTLYRSYEDAVKSLNDQKIQYEDWGWNFVEGEWDIEIMRLTQK